MPSVPNLPDLEVARTVKVADAALPTERRGGVSCADYEEIVVNLVLLNGATGATVTAFAWSPAAGKFLPYDPILTRTGGEGRFRFRVDRAHTLFLQVTAIAGGAATDDRIRLELGGVPCNDEVG